MATQADNQNTDNTEDKAITELQLSPLPQQRPIAPNAPAEEDIEQMIGYLD